MPRQTAFQKFLIKERACNAARAFVAKHDGSFARAWKANKRPDWREWLIASLGPKHSDNYLYCAACALGVTLTSTRKRNAFVLASARKRRWIK